MTSETRREQNRSDITQATVPNLPPPLVATHIKPQDPLRWQSASVPWDDAGTEWISRDLLPRNVARSRMFGFVDPESNTNTIAASDAMFLPYPG